jgi:hypothetical protein
MMLAVAFALLLLWEAESCRGTYVCSSLYVVLPVLPALLVLSVLSVPLFVGCC